MLSSDWPTANVGAYADRFSAYCKGVITGVELVKLATPKQHWALVWHFAGAFFTTFSKDGLQSSHCLC